ncbi:hypothetical protein FHS29_004964 [Saccharothrix tamanrassetensis]|uniref:Uncharacterized protein n=1 Tax=Saccharothrix tamanrassetensis TaxID=1051531 RepID=A0A841CSC7_9PSEU|nr:hypothetical protein [Saccharothrix tamanrassetensis]
MTRALALLQPTRLPGRLAPATFDSPSGVRAGGPVLGGGRVGVVRGGRVVWVAGAGRAVVGLGAGVLREAVGLSWGGGGWPWGLRICFAGSAALLVSGNEIRAHIVPKIRCIRPIERSRLRTDQASHCPTFRSRP